MLFGTILSLSAIMLIKNHSSFTCFIYDDWLSNAELPRHTTTYSVIILTHIRAFNCKKKKRTQKRITHLRKVSDINRFRSPSYRLCVFVSLGRAINILRSGDKSEPSQCVKRGT